MTLRPRMVWLLTAALCLSGCAAQSLMVDPMAGLLADGAAAYEQEADLELLREAFPAHIKLLEVLLQSDPDHPGLHLLLARLYGGCAFTVFEPDLERLRWRPAEDTDARSEAARLRARADRFYRRGAEHALAVLERRHAGFENRLARVGDREAALAAVTVRDVPALFWYAFNLGSRVNLNRGDLRLVARAHQAEGAMRRVVALRPGFYHGAAHLFLMRYYAAQPMASGSRAEAHYRAMTALPGAARVAAEVFYAHDVLLPRGARQAFETRLAEAARLAAAGGITGLLDRVALAQAERLAAAGDRLFEKGATP